MTWLRRHGHWLLTLYVAFVFIQSLFFKFTGSPESKPRPSLQRLPNVFYICWCPRLDHQVGIRIPRMGSGQGSRDSYLSIDFRRNRRGWMLSARNRLRKQLEDF